VTPTRHILAGHRVVWRIMRWGVLAVRDFLYPKNSRVNNLVREVAHAQKQNPLSDLDQISQGGRHPRRNHLCKCWWRSVKGFRGGGGSKFAHLHWLWSSPLQHSPTTVRVCDRPASLTSQLSKVFETIVRDQVVEFLQVNKLIIVKETLQFKTLCKDDSGYITQLKQQK